MATLRDIRRRINAVTNTSKITQAMRMVSAAKLKRAQDAIMSARPYAAKLSVMLQNLVENVGENYTHLLLQKRKNVTNIAVILIAADRGLCGSFNTNVFRYTTKLINEELPAEYPDAGIKLITVGRRAVSSYKSSAELINKFPAIFQEFNFQNAKDIVTFAKNAFIDGEIDRVIVVFNEFKNLLIQRPAHITLLPIESTAIKTAEKKSINMDYIFEPDQKKILDELLPKHLDIQFWRTLLESNAAEQAARMMAIENATKNAKDLVQYLELVFNKERQAAITKEMLEIVSGANALKN